MSSLFKDLFKSFKEKITLYLNIKIFCKCLQFYSWIKQEFLNTLGHSLKFLVHLRLYSYLLICVWKHYSFIIKLEMSLELQLLLAHIFSETILFTFQSVTDLSHTEKGVKSLQPDAYINGILYINRNSRLDMWVSWIFPLMSRGSSVAIVGLSASPQCNDLETSRQGGHCVFQSSSCWLPFQPYEGRCFSNLAAKGIEFPPGSVRFPPTIMIAAVI